MAWANVTSGLITANNKVAAASWAPTTAADLTAGNGGFLIVTSDNTSSADGNNNEHQSVSDAAGNTWTKAAEWTNSNAGAANGDTVSVWYVKAGSTLSSGSAITINFSGSPVAKDVCGGVFSVDAGHTISVAGSTHGDADATVPGSLSLSGLPSAEYLLIRAMAFETSSGTLTPTSNYTAFTSTSSTTTGGLVASNMAARGEWRILTGTGDTSNPSHSTSADNASVYVAFGHAAGGNGAWYYNRLLAGAA